MVSPKITTIEQAGVERKRYRLKDVQRGENEGKQVHLDSLVLFYFLL